MDLATLEPTADSVPVPLRHPTTNEKLFADGADGKPDKSKPITISIVGMDSEQFRTRHRAIINRRLNAGKKVKVTAEEIEAESIDTIAACITGWQHVELDGKALEFSKANAKSLLTRLPWLREQLDEAIADRANFLKTSPTT
jgi:hypothetical protein